MMVRTEHIMGMPVTIKVNDMIEESKISAVFDFFRKVDEKYSPYKASSIVSKINQGKIVAGGHSKEFDEILAIADNTSHETNGYFDIWHKGVCDPSGVVKGWAIQNAAKKLARLSDNFYVEAGGDIQVSGNGEFGNGWRIGIRNPFNRRENVSVVTLHNQAIATSGTAIRGQHIYDPHSDHPVTGVVSLSVIADTILDADRIATGAFAMGRDGVYYLEKKDGFEGLAIDDSYHTTKTTGWESYEEIAI